MTKACGMWRLVVAMTLRKFCNTLEDSGEIVVWEHVCAGLERKDKKIYRI